MAAGEIFLISDGGWGASRSRRCGVLFWVHVPLKPRQRNVSGYAGRALRRSLVHVLARGAL